MTEIIQAHAEDAAVPSAVIAGAFLDLAPSRWLISDEASRRKIFPMGAPPDCDQQGSP